MKIAIVNGPNLNRLGIREPEVYGLQTYEDLITALKVQTENTNLELVFYQSNSEGELIDYLHLCDEDSVDGIVINAGALSHYSYALSDAIASINIPCVEVHISNVYTREEFRQKSVLAKNCIGLITGFGFFSYNLGFFAIVNHIKEQELTQE